jgi:hypothetical protein
MSKFRLVLRNEDNEELLAKPLVTTDPFEVGKTARQTANEYALKLNNGDKFVVEERV